MVIFLTPFNFGILTCFSSFSHCNDSSLTVALQKLWCNSVLCSLGLLTSAGGEFIVKVRINMKMVSELSICNKHTN